MSDPELQIKEIRLLHLTRNAPLLSTGSDSRPQSGGEKPAYFSMFDYFDWLTVQKGPELDHMSCLGLEPKTAEWPPQVSSQYLCLVTLEGEPEEHGPVVGWALGDPFFCGRADNTFDTLPFLSIMLVTILPCPDQDQESQTAAPCISQKEIGSFLKSCANELRKLVWETGSKLNAPASGVPCSVFQVYHCVNSGNFCIAMRCQTPEPAYHIAMRVRAATLNKGKRYGFPALDCSTFSLMGTPYRAGDDGMAKVPPLSVQRASQSKVALRLSVTNQVRNQLFRHTGGGSVAEELNGLYGRYDVTLQLDPMQFWQVYPWICAHKLGRPLPLDNGPGGDEADPTLTGLLKTAMREQGAQYINTRFLIHVEGCSAQNNNGERRRRRQERVGEENKVINDKLQKILWCSDSLPYCQREFKECMYQLQDLWQSYSSLRYQDDSFINGNMLLAQISMLLDAACGYIESIDSALNEEMFYKTLVSNMRSAINSISHFQKLMLSINQQSIQAPNYEVRMYADMEKFVVAYTEFSRRFLAEHFPSPGLKAGLSKHRQLIFPIIIVDMVRGAIQASPLFLLPYHKADGRDLLTSNPSQERLLLSIEIPDISAFGHLYGTLPLICHELFHNFRVLSRDKRNDALAKFLLHRVAKYIVQRWIDQVHEGAIYTAFGRLEEDLLTSTLAEQLETAYLRLCGDTHKTANIGVLLSNILLFLSQNVFALRGQSVFQRPINSPSTIKKNLRQLCGLALEVMEGPPDWMEQYQVCYNYLEQLEQKQRTADSLAAEEAADKETLRELLLPLVDEVFLNILGEYTAQAVDGGMALCRQVSRLEEQLDVHDRKSPEIAKFTNQLYGLVQQASVDRLVPDRVDHWIQEIYGIRAKLSELLRPLRADPAALTEEHTRGAALAWEALDYAVCGLCRAIKDAGYLYLLLCGSVSDMGTLKLYRGILDGLLRQYHDKLRMKLELYYSDQADSGRVLHSAPQMQELLAPLGCDLEQEEPFAQGLERALLSCSKKDLEALVNDSTVLYREVFADLGMCVALGLNCFGYLRVLARNDTFCKGCRNIKGASLPLERMLLVAETLLTQEEQVDRSDLQALREKLRENCLTSFHLAAGMVEEAMSSDGRESPAWRNIRCQTEDLVRVGEYSPPVHGVPAFPVTVSGFGTWICDKQRDSVPELYQQFQALWNLVHLFNYLSHALATNEKHPLREHFLELQKMVASKWREKEQQHPQSPVLARVGSAYNDPDRANIPMRDHEQFKDTLSFVLYYYYHSWNVYERSLLAEDGFRQQLDILMGGGAR